MLFELNKKSCVCANDFIDNLGYHKNCEDATENPLRRDFLGAFNNENVSVFDSKCIDCCSIRNS